MGAPVMAGLYQYRGVESVRAELERLDKAKEAARQELKERRTLLMNLRREQKRLEELRADIATVDKEVRHLTAIPAPLPPPIHGGPAGLRAATQEIASYNRRNKAA